MPAPTNAFEQLGREKKARAIADAIWKGIDRAYRTDSRIPGALAALEPAARDQVARDAGYKKGPSEKTWARVVELVREKVQDERHWRSLEQRVG